MQAVRLPERLGRINTPLSWSEWDRALGSHPDQRFRRYIVEGIRYGFRVGFDYQTPIVSSQHNMPSARAGLNITVQKWRDIVSDQKQKCQTHVCECQSIDRRVSMKLPLPPKASTYP